MIAQVPPIQTWRRRKQEVIEFGLTEILLGIYQRTTEEVRGFPHLELMELRANVGSENRQWSRVDGAYRCLII